LPWRHPTASTKRCSHEALDEDDCGVGTIRTYVRPQTATWILSRRVRIEMLAPSSNWYNDMIASFTKSSTESSVTREIEKARFNKGQAAMKEQPCAVRPQLRERQNKCFSDGGDEPCPGTRGLSSASSPSD
jgi:hypothetical protein